MELVLAVFIIFLVYLYDRFSKKTPKTDDDWFSECSDSEWSSCSESCSDVIITIHR